MGVRLGTLLMSVVKRRWRLARASLIDWEWLVMKLPLYLAGVVKPLEFSLVVVVVVMGALRDRSSSRRLVKALLYAMML